MIAIVTGSGGLIGSECVRFLAAQGYDVIGVDNDMRRQFFGDEASTAANSQRLSRDVKAFRLLDIDIRDADAITSLFKEYGSEIDTVIHTAAQPSHDWAAREPLTDFSINATGTLNLLEATRLHAPDASFVFTSTNKVYGDTPNTLPFVEGGRRWDLHSDHPYAAFGFDENLSIDQSMHSLFGVSKTASDLLCQEYGRYFGLKTGIFRGGCLTGPAHVGAELHGFLAYLVRCALSENPYTIFGYKGKQVRDNIHAYDLVSAFWQFIRDPRPGEVYNIGGGRHCNCSVLEAIDAIEELSGMRLNATLSDQARRGDHIWWISDVRKFQSHYPQWRYRYALKGILLEIIEALA